MTLNMFMSTITMLGWKKVAKNHYEKTINSQYIVLLCRESGVLVLFSLHTQNLNEYQPFETVLKAIREDFKK